LGKNGCGVGLVFEVLVLAYMVGHLFGAVGIYDPKLAKYVI